MTLLSALMAMLLGQNDALVPMPSPRVAAVEPGAEPLPIQVSTTSGVPHGGGGDGGDGGDGGGLGGLGDGGLGGALRPVTPRVTHSNVSNSKMPRGLMVRPGWRHATALNDHAAAVTCSHTRSAKERRSELTRKQPVRTPDGGTRARATQTRAATHAVRPLAECPL